LIEDWTPEQREAFDRDGFLIVEEGFIDDEAIGLLRDRFDRLFAGDYVTGIRPDEVNWVAGRDPEDRTRQICNGWKADLEIARQVLAERTGRLAADRQLLTGKTYKPWHLRISASSSCSGRSNWAAQSGRLSCSLAT
jgi:hypothetical protein